MSKLVVHREVELVETSCCVCDVIFAMTRTMEDQRRRTGDGFYCPNGHSLVYKNSEYDKLKRRAMAAEAQATHEKDQRIAAERSAAATRGQLTRLRNRVGNGVCPCCKRTFKQLAAHMARKHPEYKDES